MSLDKAGYGIHGVSNPEILGQPTPIGSIGLSNWDVLELYANVQEGVTVEIK
jgi:erfK/ybiS/ycfS/ynhG